MFLQCTFLWLHRDDDFINHSSMWLLLLLFSININGIAMSASVYHLYVFSYGYLSRGKIIGSKFCLFLRLPRLLSTPPWKIVLACTPLARYWGVIVSHGFPNPLHPHCSPSPTTPLMGKGEDNIWLFDLMFLYSCWLFSRILLFTFRTVLFKSIAIFFPPCWHVCLYLIEI